MGVPFWTFSAYYPQIMNTFFIQLNTLCIHAGSDHLIEDAGEAAHPLPTSPEREYYVREITRIIGENMNAVRRELQTSNHSVSSRASGRETSRYYTVNRDFFLYEDLQKIVLKTEGVARVIREHLAGRVEIRCMFIYGSFAKSTAGAKSDIDVFIVGDIDENQLIPLVHESERALNREINYTLMRPAEWNCVNETAILS